VPSSRTNYRLRGIKEVRPAGCFRRTVADIVLTSSRNHYPRTAVMNSRLFLIPAILAATAAFGASADIVSPPLDAHAQAAALLSHPPTSGLSHAHEPAPAYSSALAAADAHSRAAALLSGVHIGHGAAAAVNVTQAAAEVDVQAQAAALLSGSRITAKSSPISKTDETLGQHPAVLVAQQWSTRGIDPNTFIVAHPARLTLLAASETDQDRVTRVQAQATANAGRSTSENR
jgi:hypothetical protein